MKAWWECWWNLALHTKKNTTFNLTWTYTSGHGIWTEVIVVICMGINGSQPWVTYVSNSDRFEMPLRHNGPCLWHDSRKSPVVWPSSQVPVTCHPYFQLQQIPTNLDTWSPNIQRTHWKVKLVHRLCIHADPLISSKPRPNWTEKHWYCQWHGMSDACQPIHKQFVSILDL